VFFFTTFSAACPQFLVHYNALSSVDATAIKVNLKWIYF